MDEDGIRLVLIRASELRSKITNCIRVSSTTVIPENREPDDHEEDDDYLLNIRDAFESLETQLSSLQELQQQQCYEKESFLVEIDHTRKKLLQKLKEYKGGGNLEVIHEAIDFASSTVEIENNDLLLPPYSNPPFTHKISQNGVMVNHSLNELRERTDQSNSKSSMKRWRQVGATAKTVLTFVGFMIVLSLSGFDPKVGKSDRGVVVGCPRGKILIVEDGETRCVVKERIEIPFVSVATKPDVSYGCG